MLGAVRLRAAGGRRDAVLYPEGRPYPPQRAAWDSTVTHWRPTRTTTKRIATAKGSDDRKRPIDLLMREHRLTWRIEFNVLDSRRMRLRDVEG